MSIFSLKSLRIFVNTCVNKTIFNKIIMEQTRESTPITDLTVQQLQQLGKQLEQVNIYNHI